MDTGEIRKPVQPRHFAVDERGVGLRATWHPEHGFVNVSLWDADRCVQTFHLTPTEAGRMVGYLAGVLADAVPEPPRRPPLAAVPALPESVEPATSISRTDRLRALLDRAARRLQS